MLAIKRTLLVVEDDLDFRELCRDYCEVALEELVAQGVPVEGVVQTAETLSEALAYFERQPGVDFASIDLALAEEERGLRDQDRNAGMEAGGMRLLRLLHESHRQTVAVVVSGETLLSYATDALQKYGVMAYFEKSRLSAAAYKQAVKAALLYLSAAELVSALEKNRLEPHRIVEAEQFWNAAVAQADQGGIGEKSFPEHLGLRIASLRGRFVDARTQLPFGRWTESMLKQKVVGCETDWALLQVSVANLDALRAAHASQVEPLLFFTANLLQRVTTELGCRHTFIGLLGQEYAANPRFILILDAADAAQAARLQERVEAEFRENAHHFTHNFAAKHGMSRVVPHMQTLVWNSQTHPEPFPDLPDLLDHLGSSMRG